MMKAMNDFIKSELEKGKTEAEIMKEFAAQVDAEKEQMEKKDKYAAPIAENKELIDALLTDSYTTTDLAEIITYYIYKTYPGIKIPGLDSLTKSFASDLEEFVKSVKSIADLAKIFNI